MICMELLTSCSEPIMGQLGSTSTIHCKPYRQPYNDSIHRVKKKQLTKQLTGCVELELLNLERRAVSGKVDLGLISTDLDDPVSEDAHEFVDGEVGI